MILSMTGFGLGSAQDGVIALSVEVRTGNHRFLDIHVRLSRECSFLETEIQGIVREHLHRGRVDVNVVVQSTSRQESLIDMETASAYLAAARRMRDELALSDSLDLKTLLNLPGVVRGRDAELASNQEAGRGLAQILRQSLEAALEGVVGMRREEGTILHANMLQYLSGIEEKVGAVQAMAPASAMEAQKRLEERLAILLGESATDPQRLAQEVAYLAEKSDVSEETVRLHSHLEQFRGLMESGSEVGKKMDFLLQEMQRETNTILSKASKLEITRLGIAIKADIEKLREQAQNVE